MYETITPQKRSENIAEEFNKKTDKWKAKRLGGLSKNMSMYTQTIQIKRKIFLGNSIEIDCWDAGSFVISVDSKFDINPYKKPIKIFEKIVGKQIELERS